MQALKFVPHDEPQTDFVIVRTDSSELRELMLSLGASRTAYAHCVCYKWNSRLGNLFMVGIGVLDGELVVGPRRLEKYPNDFGAGSYTVVDCRSNRTVIQPDKFGMNVLYYSDALVTNRLHLAAIVERQIDVDNSLSSTYNSGGFSFSFNTFKTPVSGVSILQTGATIEIGNTGISVDNPDTAEDYDVLTPDAYWNLIEQGACEVANNVAAIVKSGLPVYSDITGGRDSRVVFGALVASGLQHDVIFNTGLNTSTPGLLADLEIGTGLVAKYGGSYSERPRAFGYSEYTIDQNLNRRRSQVFGSYHWIVPADVRPIAPLNKHQSIKLLGGGGELYREYWQPLLFTTINSEIECSEHNLQKMFLSQLGTPLGSMYYERYSKDLIETLQNLPGNSVGSKLDAHYLNFRNRFHFGPRQSLPESISTLNAATSPALLKASRGLPATERASGRVLFDVTRALDEELAFLPYDKVGDPSIFKSRYHRKSKFDNLGLSLRPATDIALNTTDRRQFVRPQRPADGDWDFHQILDDEIDNSIDQLSDRSSIFSFLIDQKMHDYVDWAKSHSPRNRSALASKLRAFADYSQYA